MSDDADSPLDAVGVVLCGGQSKRMGFSKADLPFGSQSLLRRVVDRVRQSGLETVIVAAAEEQTLPNDLPASTRIVRDSQPQKGPLEALRVALRAAAPIAESAFVATCDAPFLEPKLVRALFAQQGDYEVVVPFEERFLHPLLAIYRSNLADRIDELIAADQMRPLFLIERSRSLRVDIESLRAVDPQLRSFRNLNHPQDYLDALASEGLDAPPDFPR